jgi:hypothetical protein
VYVTVVAVVLATAGSIALVIAVQSSQRIAESTLGVGLMLAGIVVGTGVRQWLQTRKVMLADETSRLLDGTRNRAALTQSLAIEVDQLLTRCRTVDERFLGASIAIMIDEYQQAQGFDDRHRALAASVDFLEKLMKRLSPWYIRYEKLIAAIALLGIIPGVFKIVATFSRP